MRNFILLLFVFCLFINAKCKKDNPDINALPPLTQSGNNTLGFLLNGQAWIPKGNNGTANLSIDVDFGFNKGIFNIASYQILSDSNREYFGIGIKDSLNYLTIPSTSSISQTSLAGIRFSNNSCSIDFYDTTVLRSGSLTITKLDRTNRIIAGIFNATFSKPGCSTIFQITEGRFDMKY